MKELEKDQKFEQLVQKIEPHSKLLRAWQLQGGVSAQVTALEVEGANGQFQKMVVRRHGPVDLKQNPNIAADEFKLLEILHSAGLVTPAPYYLDQSSEIFSTPCLVIEYLEGKSEFAPSNLGDFIFQLATHLAKIHRIDCSQVDLSFLPEQAQKYSARLSNRPAQLDDSLSEGRIRDVLEAVWPVPQRNKTVLLHGDYWPGNLIWKDERLVGIIDWEDAATGDPLADVANTRLEMLWAFGVEAMHAFTRHYQSMNTLDFGNLPYWDLCAALRPASRIAEWAGDALTEKRMREGHSLFLRQVLAQLGVQ